MQPPAGKLKKSCGKITNFYDKKEPSGPEVNPKSQTKIRNIAIFKMKAHIRRSETNRNGPADFHRLCMVRLHITRYEDRIAVQMRQQISFPDTA